MRHLFFILALAFVACSCTTQKKCSRRFPCTEIDSISVITKTLLIFRDTTITITIPGKDSIQKIPVYLEKGLINSKISRIENDFAISTSFVENGLLIHELIQKKQKIKKTIIGAIKESASITDKSQTITLTPKVINKLSGFQWFQIYAFRIMATILLLFFCGKYAFRLLKPL